MFMFKEFIIHEVIMIRSADKSKIKCGPTKTIGIFSSTLFLQCILPMPNIVLKGLKAIC